MGTCLRRRKGGTITSRKLNDGNLFLFPVLRSEISKVNWFHSDVSDFVYMHDICPGLLHPGLLHRLLHSRFCMSSEVVCEIKRGMPFSSLSVKLGYACIHGSFIFGINTVWLRILFPFQILQRIKYDIKKVTFKSSYQLSPLSRRQQYIDIDIFAVKMNRKTTHVLKYSLSARKGDKQHSIFKVMQG